MKAPKASDSRPVGPTPPGWGNDKLTEFLDHARRNQWATFHIKKPAVRKLIAIDEQFAKVSKDWRNPSNQITAQLFLRCHAAFRAAAGLGMSGYAVETYVQCRAMLECAAYAAHIHRNPSLGLVWLNRHDSDATMKASRKAFRYEDVLGSIIAANKHAGERFNYLYQWTIDSGAHPNERSVSANLQTIEKADRLTVKAVLLHSDNIYLDAALMTVARCGMISLEMLQVIYNAKFELLGINAAMLELRKGL